MKRFVFAFVCFLSAYTAQERIAGAANLVSIRFWKSPSKRVAEYAEFSYWEFCHTEIDANGNIIAPKLAERLHFLGDKELTPETRAKLARLKPGMARATVEKTWSENGGLVPCQFLLLEKHRGPDFVTVRIEWRPAVMPERIFNDRKLRERWIGRHAPLPAPDDVVMHISRPYLAKYVID